MSILYNYAGERPYVCSECPSSFARSDILRIHMRRHTGEQPYQCLECGAQFSRTDKLRTHLRLHSGETFRSVSEALLLFTATHLISPFGCTCA